MLKGFGRRPLARRLGEPPGAGVNAEGFRTPAPCTTVGRAAGGRRSKASQGGNRGEEGRCLVKRGLWGFLGRRQIACVGAQPDGAQS
jgi:hypothetical protein